MAIGSIGGTSSFWQQDQDYWQKAKQTDNYQAATSSVINAIASAQTNLGKGMASIANQAALARVNSQLGAAIQAVLTGNTSTSSSDGTGSSSASASSAASGSPAQATGTVPLTLNTPLALLGFAPGGSVTVSAGQNTTVYASTGSDTIGNLLTALNANNFGNAQVNASLGRNGRLVITGRNDTDTITIGGVYASNIGFAVGNNTFKAVAPAAGGTGAASSSTGSAASTNSASGTGSTSTSGGATQGSASYPTTAFQLLSSAASLLADSGAGGSLVDMLS
jgi:hypothetical protein